jgi:hypothetical protein
MPGVHKHTGTVMVKMISVPVYAQKGQAAIAGSAAYELVPATCCRAAAAASSCVQHDR